MIVYSLLSRAGFTSAQVNNPAADHVPSEANENQNCSSLTSKYIFPRALAFIVT